MRSIRISVAVAILAIGTSSARAQSPSRGLTVEDVLSLQNLSGLVLSPDSGSLAVIIDRPQSAKERYMRGYSRSDVWLVPLEGGARRNLTNGAADQSGWWSPVWSPDGTRIAMLSNQGGDNVRLHLWDKTGRTRRLSDRGIDMYTTFVAPDARSRGPIVWLDRTTVLVAELPAGKAPDWFDELLRTSRLAPQQWAKSERGEAAVSILESGPGHHHPNLALELRAYDVVRGTSRVLGTIPYFDQGGGGGSRTVQISPDGKTLAILATTGHVTMNTTHVLGRNRNAVRRLGMLPVGGGTVTWVDSAFITGLGPWSPDGTSLVAIGKPDEWNNVPGEDLYLVSAMGTVTRATPGDWRVTAAVWTANGIPVAYVQPPRQSATSAATGKKKRTTGWLRLDPGTSGVPIATEIGTAPTSLTPTTNPNLYLAVADSALWSIDVGTGRATKLSGSLQKVTSIVGLPNGAKAIAAGEALIRTEERGVMSFYRVPIGSHGTSVRVTAPSASAQAEIHVPTRRGVVFRDVERVGTFVTFVPADGRAVPPPLLALNEHLAAIPDPKRIMFDYRGIEGDSLKGLVILPPDYQPGKRLPTVVWVYAGSIVRDSLTGLTRKNSSHTLNLLPLVTRGYALLIPSMPLDPEGEASDPYLELPKGVLTAVDRLIEMGIADPKRLGVIGQSYGGYSTYSLITYTNRFKVAVSLAGVSDLVSLYGQFDVRDEYLEAPHENLFYQMLSEGGQTRMGAPFWDNLWRYLRNSPIYFVDRVETPLLIIGADQDYVTMTQGEQFFTALHRQGKVARFLRYWGDGHVIESRGNVLHMWQQIFEWFDRYVGG